MGKKVMVIDDSFMVRQQVGRVLKGAGFEVIEAGDGIEALERLAATTGVALIICDVNMPRMNGIDFLENMRKNSAYAGLPVVMLTTEGQVELVQQAKSLGAKAWMTKPFKPEHIIAAATKLTATAA
ncbi:MAG: Chemotaxis regulator - transmits chemoreceptor signals to flagelllar motor component CheY [Labilithrix sp.]|nr:Chemotaxis regulator - transmits chemoreceptor signals to flagelllar motor component CheY [Labilithrix sp.]